MTPPAAPGSIDRACRAPGRNCLALLPSGSDAVCKLPLHGARSIQPGRARQARCVVLGLVRSAATNEALRPSIALTDRTQSTSLDFLCVGGDRSNGKSRRTERGWAEHAARDRSRRETMPSEPPRPTCAGAAHKTPSPGLSTPNTVRTYGQPAPLVGADESQAPKARRLVHQAHTAKSPRRWSRRTFRGEVGAAGIEPATSRV